MTMNQDAGLLKKQFWGIVFPILMYLAIVALPTPEGLTVLGQRAIALMAAAVFVWIAEPIAVTISTPLFVLLQVPLGLCKLPEAMQSFTGPLFIFLFIMFCLAAAMKNSGFTHRIALYATLKANGSPQRLIVLFIFLTSFTSTIVADMPVAVMMLPICLAVLERNELDKNGSNFGSCLLIGVAMASLLGGIGTPAGSAMNMLVIQLLSNSAHLDISFMEWSALGMPMVIILTPILAWICCKLIPSEITSLKGMEEIEQEYRKLGPLSSKEIKFIVIFGLNIILWYTDKLHHLPMQVISMIAVAAFALPGVDVFNWKRDGKDVNWDPIMLVGGSVGLATTLWKTGAASFISDNFLGVFSGMPIVALLAVVAVFTMVIQFLVPASSAVVAVLGAPLLALAVNNGLPPASLVIALGICSSASMLTPINPNYLILCKSGYTRIRDMYILGIPVCIAWVIVLVGVMYFIGRPMGYL